MACDKVSEGYSEEAHLSDQDSTIWQFGRGVTVFRPVQKLE